VSLSKKEIIRLLKEENFDGLLKLYPNKKILSILLPLTYNKKDPISWLAIETIGVITKELSASNPEAVRNFVGRLLWMIRDESGGIGWSAPEILGEIVRNNPMLCSDIATIIASFHEEEMLRQGVLWAIGRIGTTSTEMVEYAIPRILPYLHSPDPTIRGYTAWALGEIGAAEAINELEKLKNDKDSIVFYENRTLKEKTVGEVATVAIEKLKSRMS